MCRSQTHHNRCQHQSLYGKRRPKPDNDLLHVPKPELGNVLNVAGERVAAHGMCLLLCRCDIDPAAFCVRLQDGVGDRLCTGSVVESGDGVAAFDDCAD